MDELSSPSRVAQQASFTMGEWKPFLLLTGLLLIVRTLFLLTSPVDLISDEAYYWDWSRRLDICYYSKPPMIAWLNWLSTTLGGVSPFMVRVSAMLLATSGLFFVYDLGRMMYGPRVGLIAMLLIALTPGNTAQSALMTIDAPFLFCWCGALWSSWRWLNSTLWNRWVFVTGGFLLLGILSKQTMCGFIPLMGLFLLLSKPDRTRIFSLSPYMIVAIGSLAIVPLLYWNMQHDWLTFQHTASHFDTEQVNLLKRLSWFGEFAAGQVALVSPLLWFALAIVFVVASRKLWSLERNELYLLCFSGIPMWGVLLLAFRQRLEPNWPAAFYPAGIVLVAGVLLQAVPVAAQIRFPRNYLRWSLTSSAFCVSLFYLATWIIPLSPLANSSWDFTARLRGWQELAHDVDAILPADYATGKYQFVATTGRSTISELAFYLPSHPVIHRFNPSDRIDSQYDYWGVPHDLSTHETIILTTANQPLNQELSARYQEVSPLGQVDLSLGKNRERGVKIWIAKPFPQQPHSASPNSQIAREIQPSTSIR
jgi:undecaprenyl-diphosphatase